MWVYSFIPAFIHIPPQFAGKAIIRVEQSDHFQWNFVEDLPTIAKLISLDVEVLHCIESGNVDPVCSIRTKLDAQAAVRIDLKIKIIFFGIAELEKNSRQLSS